MTRCLIVDDSPVIRKVARRILSDGAIEIADAANGSQAIEQCMAEMPDVVLLDSELPDLPTLEIIDAIRELPGGKAARIMLCLNELDLTKIMRAKRAGACHYMLKPFDRPYLMAQFAGCLKAA
ncbi:response regulator [Phyllobacterium leguminum]|uniref:Two-component system chemotaxis response regulator CheY n=1 Tax=Phyllobacterium leguminum TaxID=314237 RepID=A0A318T4L0_9HYPH|nr:response regulator [Phyllobacterium leguminum]PYE87073.1 two-component system chemotaxis response regulator CheY [Phyllobacterium leguminum]